MIEITPYRMYGNRIAAIASSTELQMSSCKFDSYKFEENAKDALEDLIEMMQARLDATEST